MDNFAIGFRKPCGRLLLAAMAVALLSLSTARAADEFIDDDFFVPDECANCNLYWHGGEGCVTSRLPRWYAGADVMVLRRDMDEEVTFATFTNTTDIALGTSSFKDEFDAGVRFFAGYAINDWYRIEGLYFGSHHFNGDMAVRTNGPDGLNFPFGDMGDFARIRFSSSLDNAELNLRSRLSDHPGPLQVSLLFGGRFMKLDEKFAYQASPSPATLPNVRNVDVATSNDLLGLQVGLMAQWQCHPRSWLDYEIKGGVFTNRANQRTTGSASMEVGGRSQLVAFDMGAEKDVTAFAVDMSLIFNYQITPSLSLRFGYNAMWLSGVALGAQNVQTDVNLLTMGPAKLDHGGLVVYHGPSFGAVVAW